MKPSHVLAPITLVLLMSATSAAQDAPSEAPAVRERPVRVLIRSDDMGFTHGANVANERLMASGLPLNVSVLFAAPWYREAVEMLKAHPDVSVGVHLCANAEWKHYTWGPVADRSAVPSLVGEDGYFFGSWRELNLDHTPRVEELETEFRAQIERALATGLRIDYLDNHMGAGLATPEQRAMVERLAEEYGLGFSGGFGEVRPESFAGGSYEEQLARLVSSVEGLSPDSLYLIVFHVGTDTPELRALEDLNEGGPPSVARQRQIELDLLLSGAFREALERNNVQPLTYRALVRERAQSRE